MRDEFVCAFVFPHTQNTKEAITAHLLYVYSVYTTISYKNNITAYTNLTG